MTGAAQQGGREIRQLIESGAPRGKRFVQLNRFCGSRCMRPAEALTCGHQLVELFAMLPIELIDCPH